MMMDRQVVRQCDMEVMKMAMLKHEETFRSLFFLLFSAANS